MQKKPLKQVHKVEIEFTGNVSRVVKVKATSTEQAEKRALKFNPAAIGIKRGS